MKQIRNKVWRSSTLHIIGWIFSTKILIYILRLTAGIIIAHKLGPVGKGIVAAALSIPQTIAVFGHLGLPISNIYFIGKGRDKSVLLTNSIIFILVSSFIYITLAWILFPFYKNTYYEKVDNIIAFASLLLIFLFLNRHFFVHFIRGLEKYKQFNFASLIQPAIRLTVILLVLLILKKLSVAWVIIATIISILSVVLYSGYILLKKIHVSIQKFDKIQFLESIKYGLKEYLGHVFMFLNLQIDILILAALIDKSHLGIYSVAMGIAQLVMFIPSSINVVILPKISKSSTINNAKTILLKSIYLNLFFILPAIFLFYAFGNFLVPFVYGEEFAPAYKIAVILLIGTLLLSISQLINKFYSGIGRPEIKSIIRGITIPIKFITLYFLVKHFNVIGAAWSFVITNLILILLSIIILFKIQKNKLTKT